MFGYIRPLKGELKVREFEDYQSIYCGLCAQLGKKYGLAARFTVSFDLTFYAALLMAVSGQGETGKARCPAKCGRCKAAVKGNDVLERAADISVILAWFSLKDKIQDDGVIKRAVCSLGTLFLRRSLKKARRSRPEFYRAAQEHMAHLKELEDSGCASIDETADTFAALLEAAAPHDDPKIERPIRLLLYNVGRFIYLADALDDFQDDIKNRQYNPIAARYDLTETIPQPVQAQLDVLASHCCNLAASAIALLELSSYAGIVENIIYIGMPAVWNSVKNGTFQRKARKGKNTL